MSGINKKSLSHLVGWEKLNSHHIWVFTSAIITSLLFRKIIDFPSEDDYGLYEALQWYEDSLLGGNKITNFWPICLIIQGNRTIAWRIWKLIGPFLPPLRNICAMYLLWLRATPRITLLTRVKLILVWFMVPKCCFQGNLTLLSCLFIIQFCVALETLRVEPRRVHCISGSY